MILAIESIFRLGDFSGFPPCKPPTREKTGCSVKSSTRNMDGHLANSAFQIPDTSGHDVMTQGLIERLQRLQTHTYGKCVTTVRSDVVLTIRQL